MTNKEIHIIGGGMAGAEAAWQAANIGVPVILHEMRPVRKTDAHKTDNLAELVCSNSFRSDDYEHNAVGLMHEEMRLCNSLIMQMAEKAKVPAGGALAVDRDIFSKGITKAIEEHPLISIKREEITGIPPTKWNNVIIATGPLTSPSLAEAIKEIGGEEHLSFYDAIAPVIYKDSINFDIAWLQSRYDKGDGADYINCPMSKEQYETFIDELKNAEYGLFKDWEMINFPENDKTSYFDGCMPIEVMAERGKETLRFGPMKPVGLTNPNSKEQPYAVVQLRQDNKLGTLYNMVGFQTKMKYGEQTRIFRTIPGLEKAEFARLGGLHKNTFINSPKLLDSRLRMKAMPNLRFAGQISGCEGYVESAAMGLISGIMAAYEQLGKEISLPPPTTAIGAMINHITTGADSKTFQPMNINFGLFPQLPKELATEEYTNKHGKIKRRKLKGMDRKKAYTSRAIKDFKQWKMNL